MKRSPQLNELYWQWENVDDILSTHTMKAASEKYLPREPGESDINYRLRLNRTVLFPAYSRSIKNAVGKVFNQPMTVELPDALQPMQWNFDGQGGTIESFAKQISSAAIHYGIAYALVDLPREGGTPYTIYISPRDVYRINVEWINNTITLTEFAFQESYVDEGETLYQYKVFTLDPQSGAVEFSVYRDINGQDTLVDSGMFESAPGVIPVVPVYGNKVAPFYGTPSLYDLYELNARHWAVFSDYANITHHSQVPMLELRGFDPEMDENGRERPVVISSNTVFRVSEGGSVRWVEVSGAAAQVGQEMLKDLEDKMAVTGMQLFLNSAATPRTATEASLDAAEESSMLKGITLDIESALNLCLDFAASMVGINTDSVSVKLNKDYTVMGDRDFAHVKELYELGIIGADEFIAEARSRKILTATTGE